MARIHGLARIDSLVIGAPQPAHIDTLQAECDDEITRYINRAKDKEKQFKTQVKPHLDFEAELRMGPLAWWKKFGALFPRMRNRSEVAWLRCHLGSQ